MNHKLGVALIGLGKYSINELIPSLQETELCELIGLVSNSPDKIEKIVSLYNLSYNNIYDYNNFDNIINNSDIDIVYITVPTSLHYDFVLRAAKAKKHIICEKPLSLKISECEEMIQVCKDNNVKLFIGYRLHYDSHNLEMIRLIKEQTFGKLIKIEVYNNMIMSVDNWKTTELGGGPLMESGIYCVQACINILDELPVSVIAKEKYGKFKDVPETVEWGFEFKSGVIAECKTSYIESGNAFVCKMTNGWCALTPVFEYKNLKGYTSKGKMMISDNNKKQQTLMLDDFSNSIINNYSLKLPGEIGLRDIKILNCISESARTKKKVYIN